MKVLGDPDGALGAGLARLRSRYDVPQDFPPEVVAEAERAAARVPDIHSDWTDRRFVTLDPASSTDLDQAFCIEESGGDLLLHYALADIGWFAPEGSALVAEAWRRSVTLYLPDGRARLYPAVLSEAAASLLPDGPRPAIVVSVRCAVDGTVALEGAERAVIRSRAKLAYESTELADVPHLADFAARMQQAEARRGAARVDPPEQELERDGDGRYRLSFRVHTASEEANATLSLAANIAMAQALHAAGTGMFREMPAPDARAVARLRQTARGLGLDWPETMLLAEFERTIDPRTVAGAAFQLAVRRAGTGASYVPYRPDHTPWHAALAATYTHATAPMRRLADRYILDTVLALGSSGEAHGPELFSELSKVMNAADAREGAIERAVLDLAEAVLLSGREGEVFHALVTERDEKGARVQLRDVPVLARVDTRSVAAGEAVILRLVSADAVRGEVRFERLR